jgi:excisionase family DNA binding protein
VPEVRKVGLSVDEAVESSGISRSVMFELIRAGEIVSVKVGRRRIIPATALAEYFDRLAAEQRPAAGRADS